MKFVFFYNPYSYQALCAAQKAQSFLHNLGAEVVWPQSQEVKTLPTDVSSIGLCEGECDLGAVRGCRVAVVFGGDGTILQVAHILRGYGIPIVAVNLGRIGFISQIELKDVESALAAILDQKFDVQKKLSVEFAVEIDGRVHDRGWALNEISIEKSHNKPMCVFVSVNDQDFLGFNLDALLCSTPTGSTAHAFSAGGPIIWPNVDCISLVPLGAYAMFARPMIFDQDATLKIKVETKFASPVRLSCDGARICTIPSGSTITIQQSQQVVNFVKLPAESFASTLIKKFNIPRYGI